MSTKPFEIITDRILKALDEGTIPWRKPWKCGGAPRNLITGKPYRGLNIFLTVMQGYESPYWLTYRQAQERGGQIRKGEKGTPVIFWNWQTRQVPDTKGAIEEKDMPFMRYYTVFNLQQIDGLQLGHEPETFAPVASCEDVIKNMPQSPAIEHGFAQACYVPSTDVVKMPSRTSFHKESGYYTTLFHELTHSTGHASRLNRKTITEKARFGDEKYSKEELVAELGAAFLCGHTGIEQETIENSATYIKSWRDKIAEDKRLIISAASQAQRAADFIIGKQAVAEIETEAAA
jgi:antirestriction protein ArdC